MKIEDLICYVSWHTVFIDGNENDESKGTENERNVVRSLRKYFDVSVERFNVTIHEPLQSVLTELADQDPVTKLFAIYAAVAVAHVETEAGGQVGKTSNREWEFVLSMIEAAGISENTRNKVRELAKKMVAQCADARLREDSAFLEASRKDIETGSFGIQYIEPLLKAYFDAVEFEEELLVWEKNYLALKRNKRALTRLFGDFSVKKFDQIYEDLKFNLKELKQNSKNSGGLNTAEKNTDKEQQKRAKEAEKEKQKKAKEAEKEQQKKAKEAEKQRLQNEAIAKKKADLEKLNATHEISSAREIMYCRYCGELKSTIGNLDLCKREYGHHFSIKKVESVDFHYKTTFEYKPVCTKCGHEGRCGTWRCR